MVEPRLGERVIVHSYKDERMAIGWIVDRATWPNEETRYVVQTVTGEYLTDLCDFHITRCE